MAHPGPERPQERPRSPPERLARAVRTQRRTHSPAVAKAARGEADHHPRGDRNRPLFKNHWDRDAGAVGSGTVSKYGGVPKGPFPLYRSRIGRVIPPCVNRCAQSSPTPSHRARAWDAAHPCDSPPSPLRRYFYSELHKEDARTSRGKWCPQGDIPLCISGGRWPRSGGPVPKGTLTFVDAGNQGKSAGCGVG